MPRLIDAEARRLEIAEAVWRIAARAGLDAVSVRSVAREAGLAAGSVRHVFSTQAELLSFAMATLGEQLRARSEALGPFADERERAVTLLSQLLPLDEERLREAEVWLAFVIRARTDRELAPVAAEADRQLRAFVAEVAPPGADVEGLYALVDGLTLHAVLTPGSPSEEGMLASLRAALS